MSSAKTLEEDVDLENQKAACEDEDLEETNDKSEDGDEPMDCNDEDDDDIIDDDFDDQVLDEEDDLDEDDVPLHAEEFDDEDKNECDDDMFERNTHSSAKNKLTKASEEKSPGPSSSESEEESDPDEETIEQRKKDLILDGHELEQAFDIVKRLLYEERSKQIKENVSKLQDETSMEYRKPLDILINKRALKAEVARKRKELNLDLIQVYHDSESLAAHQNLENEKIQLLDTVRSELEDKIRRLEEDRHNIDLQSDMWESQLSSRKPKKRSDSLIVPATKERRKKPVHVTGPFVIYMLDDAAILEDWAAIKKAVKQKQTPKRRTAPGLSRVGFMARYQEGKLNYQGDFYSKGHRIIIDTKESSPVHATITAINTGEIWVKKSDGNKSKLYIAQLQKGKYTIRRVGAAF